MEKNQEQETEYGKFSLLKANQFNGSTLVSR